jgi:choline dehydrogenase
MQTIDRRSFIAGSSAGLGIAAAPLLAAVPSRPRARIGGIELDVDELLSRPFDYVIVGGGAAGCVLAYRLTERSDLRVLLIEAGEIVDDPAVVAPQAWPGLAGGPYDWSYLSVPQSGLLGRAVAQPRGRGLGGSTLINAMGFQRGGREAYDAWAEITGDTGWSYASLLPFFKRMETASGGANAWRGGDGPLHVLAISDVDDKNPMSLAFAAAARAAGYPENPDWNAERADGLAFTQLTIHEGKRVSTAEAYAKPIMARENFALLTGAAITGLQISRGQCDGVALGARTIRPEREVILSAGTFDTARLLLLSGVGDAAALKRVGVKPIHHLPGVGQNLQDHPLMAGLLFRSPQLLAPSVYNHCDVMLLAQSGQGRGFADLQLMALSVPFVSPVLGPVPDKSFSIVPALMAPHSKGQLTLASADPRVPALIDPNYLNDPRDVEALVDALEMGREIASRPEMRAWVAKEVFPGRAMINRADMKRHVQRTAAPFYHPVSTCRMGRTDDPQSVVDSQFRVIGLSKIRIVDASIFPSMPQAMTMASTIMIAEKAATVIVNDHL